MSYAKADFRQLNPDAKRLNKQRMTTTTETTKHHVVSEYEVLLIPLKKKRDYLCINPKRKLLASVALYRHIHVIYCVFNTANFLLLICYFEVLAKQTRSPSPW
jgi:hypothetical protein